MIRSLGVDTKITKIIGLCLSNGLVALSGSLLLSILVLLMLGWVLEYVAGLASSLWKKHFQR
jgi:hypothetical protein